MNNIKELADIIHKLHGTKATHIESVPVKEIHEGKTVWDGIVEVFDIHGHPQTGRLYAWSHDTASADYPLRHVTVLHVPPVVSPVTAVRAAILQEYKSRAKAN